MKFTVPMLLDCLAGYHPQYTSGGGTTPVLEEIRLLSPQEEQLAPGVLYVCTDEALLALPPERVRCAGAAFACLCSGGDAQQSIRETGAPVFWLEAEGAALAQVTNHLLEVFHRLNRWEKSLDEAILTGQTFQAIVDLTQELFRGNFFLFWDTSYNILAHSRGVELTNPRLAWVVEHGFFSNEITDTLAQMDYMKNALTYTHPTFFVPPNYMNCPFILKTFVVAQRIRYSGCLYYTATEPTQGMMDLMTLFTEKLEAYIIQTVDVSHLRTNRIDRCLADLIEKPDRGEEYLQDRANVLGLQEDSPYRLCLITFREYSQEQALYLKMRIRGTSSRVVVSIYHQALVLLFCHQDSTLLARETSMEWCQKLVDLLPMCKASAAFSGPLIRVTDVSTAYKQAVIAMDYGSRFDPESPIHYYCEYYLYHMLEYYRPYFPLEKMYVQRLSLLMDDNQYKSSNLFLLHTYLTNERNISQTAKDLYMHRNSVIYRIARIEEKLNVDLDNPDIRLRLLISFRILELLHPQLYQYHHSQEEGTRVQPFGE